MDASKRYPPFVPGIEIVKAGEPYTADSVERLCFKCPLADCDQSHRNCLIRIARRRDPKLHHTMYYRDRAADPDKAARKKEQARRYYERKRERAGAQDVVARHFENETPVTGVAGKSGGGGELPDVVVSARRRRRRLQ